MERLKLFELTKNQDRHHSTHWFVWANSPLDARQMLQDHVLTFETPEVKNIWGEQLVIDEVKKAPGIAFHFDEKDY